MKYSVNNLYIALIILLIASLGAHASTITNYGDFEASTVWYNQISENTDTGYYGAPEITGDSLNFNPLGVEAKTTDAGGSITNKALLQFDVQAKAGSAIAGMDFSELGDYTILGLGNAFVDVTANFSITIHEVDGIALASAFTTASTMTFSPNADGSFSHIGSIFVPETEGGWSGSIYLNVLGMLDDELIGYDDGVTKMSVSLDNILVAYSEPGTSALIKKKLVGGLSITADVIPEPASLVLIAGTGSLLAFIRRRFIV